jgi:hypothetical protein
MFSTAQFQCNRGLFNTQSASGSIQSTQHSYKNEDNTFAEISGANFFPANFGFEEGLVQIGDYLIIDASDQSAIVKITGISPVAISNNYLTNSFNQLELQVAFFGPWATPQTKNITLLKLNDIVTLSLRGIDPVAAVNSAPINSPTGVIPIPYRPAANIILPMYVRNNGVILVGVTSIMTSGTIEIAPSLPSPNFTPPGNAQAFSICASWSTTLF